MKLQCQGVDDNHVACTNEARYIDAYGQFTCGICPIKYGVDSIKLADVPTLLAWAREVLRGGTMGGSSFEALRKIIGVVPEPPLSVDTPCSDPGCSYTHGPDQPHRTRFWNALWGTEEIMEW